MTTSKREVGRGECLTQITEVPRSSDSEGNRFGQRRTFCKTKTETRTIYLAS